MRTVGVFHLMMALVWVPIAVFAPYESDGLVRHFQIFNAVIFSAFTAIWAIQELGTYRARKRNGRHQASSPIEEEAVP